MTRGWWFVATLAPFAFGCASSVPVECPESFGLSEDGVECQAGTLNEPDAGPEPRDEPDGGISLSVCRDADCDDGNECTIDRCEGEECASVAAEDGTACVFEDGAGICEAGVCNPDCEIEDCREVYPCTEQGLRNAVADGGDIVIGCNGPTTVKLTEGELLMLVNASLDGQGLLTVDAEGTSRVFHVTEGVKIELAGLNITGGAAATEAAHSGGGVGADRGTETTLRDCHIYGNSALIHGGGVRTSGQLTIDNCEITDNTAMQRGAGIAVFGESTISNTTVADNASMDDGGGVYVSGGEATFVDSTIERNRTPGSGGAIWSSGGVVLDGTAVRDNVSGDDGGGVRLWESSSALTTRNGTVFENNSADVGGAIATYSPRELSISDTEFIGNSASDGSGGAINNSGASLVVTDCEFNGNTASNAAGAVYHRDAPSVFRRTTFSGHRAKQGGAFRFFGGNTKRIDGFFENCTISDSAATTKAGTFLNRKATVLLVHTTLTQSTAVEEGSGVHLIEASELHAQNSVLDVGCYADGDSFLVSVGYNAVLTPDVEQCVLNPLEGVSTDLAVTREQIGLDALDDNGGSTKTQMPAADSILIDAIPANGCIAELDHDQRDEPRNGGSPCDIGSVEVQPGE